MPCMTQTSTNPLRAPHTPPNLHQQASKTPPQRPEAHLSPKKPPGTSQRGRAQPGPTIRRRRRARPQQPIQPTHPRPGAPPPHTGHHLRPRPPPSNPPREGPDHPPGLVPPTRGLDQAHRQSPPRPDHPRQRPPRDHRRPRTLASPQTHPGPARLDPPHGVGPGPDTQHHHQRHASRDRTPTTGPSGEGPPSGPEPPGAVGTGHRTNPRHRPPRRRPLHPRRRPPFPTHRQ